MLRHAMSAAAAAAVAAAVTNALATPAAAEVPTVVTDIAPVHSLVAQVMGDLGTPVLLLDRGADPHSFQLRPSQAAALAEADLVFWIGPELTPWLDRALEGTGTEERAVSLLRAEGVTLREYGEGEDHDEAGHDEAGHDEAGHAHDEHAHEDHAHEDHAAVHDNAHEDAHEGHAHEGTDPHAWLDPANARAWVAAIAARLSAADPGNAETYAANAAAATAALDALDAEMRATLAPAAGRPLFLFHDAYGYLAAAYGLTVGGTIAEGDAADPGARHLAEVRDALAGATGACLFAEANHDPAYVETLAEATGIRPGTLDPDGAAQEPGADLYGRMMRALAAGIAGCAAQG